MVRTVDRAREDDSLLGIYRVRYAMHPSMHHDCTSPRRQRMCTVVRSMQARAVAGQRRT